MPNEDLEKFDYENNEIDGLKPGDMSRLNIPWYKKIILKLSPKLFFKLHSRSLNVNDKYIDLAQKLFGQVKRIDIQPLSGGHRGFIIYLDNKFSLWFYQDGDHFVYDGFEMGDYENGEVTVFDNLKPKE